MLFKSIQCDPEVKPAISAHERQPPQPTPRPRTRATSCGHPLLFFVGGLFPPPTLFKKRKNLISSYTRNRIKSSDQPRYYLLIEHLFVPSLLPHRPAQIQIPNPRLLRTLRNANLPRRERSYWFRSPPPLNRRSTTKIPIPAWCGESEPWRSSSKGAWARKGRGEGAMEQKKKKKKRHTCK